MPYDELVLATGSVPFGRRYIGSLSLAAIVVERLQLERAVAAPVAGEPVAVMRPSPASSH